MMTIDIIEKSASFPLPEVIFAPTRMKQELIYRQQAYKDNKDRQKVSECVHGPSRWW